MSNFRMRAKSRSITPTEAARAGLCWEAADEEEAAVAALESLGGEVYCCCVPEDGDLCDDCAREAQEKAVDRAIDMELGEAGVRFLRWLLKVLTPPDDWNPTDRW